APTCLGPARRPFQLGGNPLIGLQDRSGAVPGMAVRINPGIGGVRQRLVRGPAFLRGRRPVHRRPDQRVPERHPFADRHQPPTLPASAAPPPPPPPRPPPPPPPPHQHRLAARLRRGDQQQLLGGSRENLQSPKETFLDPSRQCLRIQDAEPAGQLRERQRAR